MAHHRVLMAAFAMFIAGCTTFRGPGEFHPPGETPIEYPTSRAPEVARSYGRLQGPVKFDWPIDEARLTQGYRNSRRSPHWGIDLASPRGTPILAADSGVVIYTGKEFSGYGKLVVIEHDAEWATLYSHLDDIIVKEGQVVERGQRLGAMGRTGRATGVHLHFEIRRNRQPVNPLAYLPTE